MSGPDAAVESKTPSEPPARRRRRPPKPPSLPHRIRHKLKRLTIAYSDSLRADPDLAPAIENNREAVRSDIVRLIRLQFPLKRGRPTDPLLDAACRMIDQGKSVPEVLCSQIPDWEKLDAYTRLLASKGLHQAHQRRHKTRRGFGPQKSTAIAAPESPQPFDG